MKGEKDYWIEVDFVKPTEVYQVILKRRADADNENKPARVNSYIKVQYKDA